MARSLLLLVLPAAANLATAPRGVAFDDLAAGVGVDLGVEHEHVDVLARAEHVVESAEADVEGPSVAAQDPHALANERVSDGQQVARIGRIDTGELALQNLHPLALCVDFGFGLL